ncbi:MAG: glycoside hydrolase family 2 protein [Leptolyngbya sp. PLA3]|nr:MAG: glycoside hydrolase family 2 protein [Cyanobacteria bacterium CYA]MCE7967193.1 glycoside hydrolase family 2 protein [Leptolyngbya sp. PL-A3]
MPSTLGLLRQGLECEHWTVRAFAPGEGAPAIVRNGLFKSKVPGCVHLDLARAHIAPHPGKGFAERQTQWIGRTGWILAAEFMADERVFARQRCELVLRGVDGPADVRVNGRTVGRTASSFLTHRYPVTGELTKGRNRVELRFEPILAFIEKERQRLGARPHNGDEVGWAPFQYVRAPACMFGWDWGPRVATCGLDAAAIETWSTARLRRVRPHCMQDDSGAWSVQVDVELDRTGDDAVRVSAMLRDSERDIGFAGSEVNGPRQTTLHVRAPGVETWWPRGHGGQKLYDLHVWVSDAEGTALDDWTGQIGFRTVRLNQGHSGERFAIEVNGRAIFCKGSNWIPDALFSGEVTGDRVRKRVEQACAGNMNMLRVWGGGRYEQEEFYRACDELGVLVWQDFMLACAMYPEEGELPGLIEREAEEQVSRLCAHPSVALWCGGNENVWARQAWGWKQRLGAATWGERYITEILPGVCARLDPTRPYWANSPWSGSGERDAQDVSAGDRHTWDKEFEGYRELTPLFTSELGRQSPATWATLVEAIGREQMGVGSEAMGFRQRALAGNKAIYANAMQKYFGREPEHIDEWLYLAHVLQGRALTIAAEWHRLHQPRCAGLLTWQLNDCWAGLTWSVIDSGGRLKPGWHALRRAFAPRVTTIQPIDGRVMLGLINDTPEPFEGVLTVRRVGFDGREACERRAEARVDARSSAIVGGVAEMVGGAGDERSELVVVEGFGERALWFWRDDVDLAYGVPVCRGRVEKVDGGYELRLHAETLVRDVVIEPTRLSGDAECDDQLVTLLPGERRTLTVRTKGELEAERLLRPPVLMCLQNSSQSAR